LHFSAHRSIFSNMKESRPPWDTIHPDLTDLRIGMVARIIRDCRDAKADRRLPPDCRWNLGCDFYAWAKYGLQEAAKGECKAWLVVPVSKADLDFMFQIGSVPAKFYNPDSQGQPARTLHVSIPELRAQQQAFQFGGDPLPPDNVIRFAVEADEQGKTTSVELVQLDSEGHIIYNWPITLDGPPIFDLGGDGSEGGVDLGDLDIDDRESEQDEEGTDEGEAQKGA